MAELANCWMTCSRDENFLLNRKFGCIVHKSLNRVAIRGEIIAIISCWSLLRWLSTGDKRTHHKRILGWRHAR
jgi:hypothetical protein